MPGLVVLRFVRWGLTVGLPLPLPAPIPTRGSYRPPGMAGMVGEISGISFGIWLVWPWYGWYVSVETSWYRSGIGGHLYQPAIKAWRHPNGRSVHGDHTGYPQFGQACIECYSRCHDALVMA